MIRSDLKPELLHQKDIEEQNSNCKGTNWELNNIVKRISTENEVI
jgi:hypothetical protein